VAEGAKAPQGFLVRGAKDSGMGLEAPEFLEGASCATIILMDVVQLMEALSIGNPSFLDQKIDKLLLTEHLRASSPGPTSPHSDTAFHIHHSICTLDWENHEAPAKLVVALALP